MTTAIKDLYSFIGQVSDLNEKDRGVMTTVLLKQMNAEPNSYVKAFILDAVLLVERSARV